MFSQYYDQREWKLISTSIPHMGNKLPEPGEKSKAKQSKSKQNKRTPRKLSRKSVSIWKA